MDPLKTLVNYALMPLRVVVQLGDMYVGTDDQPQSATSPPAPTPTPAPKPHRARPQASTRPKPIGDPAIARKVESAIFRDEDVPKGEINVNVVDGVAYLRGQARTPEMINDLEEQARAVPEVVGVENLLHLQGTPPQPKTRRTKPNSSIVEDRRVGASNGAEKPL